MERTRGGYREPSLDPRRFRMVECETGDGPLEQVLALLRPNDVAKLLSVSRAWVYEAARTGRIPSVRLGGEDGPLRFVAADLEDWLAEARSSWLPGQRGQSGSALGGRQVPGFVQQPLL